MGSSSGKKHKKDKKHKHRELTDDEGSGHHHRHHKSRKHKEHREQRHKHKRDRERSVQVIAVQDSDSDSSDCVEVPVDSATLSKRSESESEYTAPPPPQLSKSIDYERERERKEREYEREKEREREKDRERARERDRERERDHERDRERDRLREKEKEYEMRERERYEREREMERRRAREQERERRDFERERREVEKEREQRYHHQHERERERPNERERIRERSASKSPIPEDGAGDVLSIEETNKLRAKLGLKPLEVSTGPTGSKSTDGGAAAKSSDTLRRSAADKDLSSYKDEWGEFLHKPAGNLKEKAEAEKMREKLKQRKEKRFLEQRLAHIRTLGESDDETDDVSNWVQRNKQVQDLKKEADKRAKALEEMDAEFGVGDLIESEKQEQRRKAYSDKHLKGLRVEHDMDNFAEGKTVILTLKDKDVLDEQDDDTLVNVNMIEDERYRKNVENKKLNPLSYGYNVYEEQYDEFGNPIERGILEKYDEDVDGKPTKKKNFVIGENLDEEREHRRKLLEIKTKLAGKRLETLADTKIQLASDTFSEVELATFKKPKKKVKKLRQKLKAEDLLQLNNDEPMQQHFGSRRARHRDMNADDDDDDGNDDGMNGVDSKEFKNEEDEDDLERVLAKARKIKQQENIIKKPPPIDIESIKQEIKSEPADTEEGTNAAGIRGADGNIILNATAEFCRTLGDIPTYGMSGNREEDPTEIMDFDADDGNDERTGGGRYDEPECNHGTWNSVNPDEVIRPVEFENLADNVEEVAILDEEPDVGAGVANALRLALSKGYLEKEELNRPSNSKMAHLQAKNYSIEDKSAAGDDDKFGRRDRFHAGPIMDFRDKESFKPNVKLDYIDDNGRILNLKEAFRYLSHKFHGKGPGKNKIEKRLKKMEQEGLMKTMSSTDTPLGTLTMLQQKQKETKTPYVVLSGGKQNAATSVGSTTISKYK